MSGCFVRGRNRSNSNTSECSSFKIFGKTTICLSNIRRQMFYFEPAPLCSPLAPYAHINMTSQVTVNVKLEGFLTVGEDNSKFIVWNRRWSVLNNTEICFWNYPSEAENKEPMARVSLEICSQSSVSTADRSTCPKPRTLLIETKSENSMDIKRLFLSYDSMEEKRKWETTLNMILGSQKKWNHSVS